MTTEIPSWLGVAASVSLVVIAALVSLRAQLHLTRELLVAATRAFVQLLAVGAVLAFLFREGGLLGALAWVAGMVIVAGVVAARRTPQLPAARSVAWWSVGIGTTTTLGVLLILGVVSAEPLVVIPVGGMVVNGAMVATTLTVNRMTTAAVEQRAAIEARLALGLTAKQSFASQVRAGVRTALVPAIDSTKVVGLISLPGAMTGLILAGVSPMDAIRYQIVVMYMLLAAASLAAMIAAGRVQAALFDEADRLRRLPG